MTKKYPFKFLDAYARDDRDIFFGREEEVEALYQMVFQTDLILIYGASGTGKTSLIQCGLASKFQPYEWLALSVRRGKNLNEALEKALAEASERDEAESPSDNLDWLDAASPRPAQAPASPVAERLKNLYLRHFKPVFLIFDQFEELYILGSKPEQDRFTDTVREILRIEQPVKIILSVREEYLGYLYEFERKVPELLRKKLRIESMNLERVNAVVQSIGQLPQSNVRLRAGEESDIGLRIFEKLKGRENTRTIELPYLQVFLDKLYLQCTGDQRREAEATFTLAALQQMGDIGDVLRNFLDEQVLLIAPKLDASPETLWKTLSPFVTLDGTKEPLSAEMLQKRLPEAAPGFLAQALQAFQSGRILRFDEKEQRYEVAHDALARQIAAKRDDDEIALLEVQRLIRIQTALPLEKRDFFSEKQLGFIEPYRAKLRLEDEEANWLTQSRAHVEAQKAATAQREREELERARQQAEQERQLRSEAERGRKRARVFSGMAAAVAVVAMVVGWLAFSQWKTAQAAQVAEQEAARTATVAAQQAETARNEANAKLTEALREKLQRLRGELQNAERAVAVYQKAGYAPLVTETKQQIVRLREQIAQTEKEIEEALGQ